MKFEEDLVIDESVKLKSNKFNIVLDFIKNLFNSKRVLYLVVLILTSSVSFLGVRPMAFAMLGVATIFNIPLVFPFIGTLISYLIFGVDLPVFVNFGISFVIYSVITSLFKFDEYSKKVVSLIKLLIASTVSSIITFLIFKEINFVYAISNVLLILAFFPVYTSGIGMLLNITKKIVFSKEEIISLALILSFLLIPFSGIHIFNFSFVNVAIMAIIMVIAWKNDWIVGTSTGVIVGLIYTISTNQSSLIITMFAFSGFIAGILNRYNKYIVVLAFVIGNMGLSAIYAKYYTLWSRLAELIVASSVIIVLPRKLTLKLEDIFGTNMGLNRGYEKLLGAGRDVKERLNAMSEVFDNLAHITTPVTEETIEETKTVIKKYLEDYKKNECISCKNVSKCLEKDLDTIASHIATRLEENKPIVKEMLPLECGLSEELILNITDIYSNMKLMRIVKEKENEANSKLAEEYKAISGLIRNIAREDNKPIKRDTKEQLRIREELKYMGYVVYEDSYDNDEANSYYEFITDILIDIDKAKKEIQKIVSDVMGKKMSIKLVLNSSKTEKSRIKLVPSSKYVIKAMVKQVRKADSSVSGDSYIVTELKDNSKIIAISDGMGSGAKSKEISETVISMIEKMGASGFNKNEIVNIINKLVKLKENGEVSSTLDMCAVNEKDNVLEFIKLGAAPSYLIKEKEVIEIKQDTMPMGMLSNLEFPSIEKEINKGDFVILISDGAMSDINKGALEEIFSEFNENDEITEKFLMDKLMERVVGSQNKIILDDVTVVVCKIV